MIWSYWEGVQPPHIQLCLASMYKCLGDDFTLVRPDTVENYVPAGTLDPHWVEMPSAALRADCLRAALLAAHGGWWWDADTLAFQRPDCVHRAYPHDVLGMSWLRLPRRILNGYIYMKPGCDAAKRWLGRVNHALSTSPGSVDWCSLGEKVLTKDLIADPSFFCIPRRLFLPIDIDSYVTHFFQEGRWRDYCQRDTVCFGLNHSYFMYHHAKEMNLPEGEWRDSPLLIHQLMADTAEHL